MICTALAAYLSLHRRMPGSRQLMLLMVAVGEWALTYFLEFMSPTLTAKLFWVFVATSYLMLLASTAILVKAYRAARHIYRKQLGTILVGISAPWIGNVIYLFEMGPLNRIDLTPVAFTISGLAFVWGLFRYQLLDILPMAREAVLDAMEDADSLIRKPLATMQSSGQKAAAIVQDLLTLARRGVTVSEVIDINAVVSAYLASPEHRLLMQRHPQVRLSARLAPEIDNIMGSPVHLSKTVMNLVANAAEAMPAGGRLRVFTEKRQVDASIRGFDEIPPGPYVVLSVTDRGTGISPQDRKRIFEPFYSRKVMGRSGTGLGMSVVWGTVKDHQGHIILDTRRGKGTCISLYFPATREPVSGQQKPRSLSDLQGRGEAILVVDDEPYQREIATEMLTALNYAAAAAASGEAAVDWMKGHRADLVILDMIMAPGMDGLETCKAIWQRFPGQRIVIASGYSETRRVTEAQRLGADGYLRKPYSMEAMGLAVRKALTTASAPAR